MTDIRLRQMVCPDGKHMCCLCFGCFDLDDLNLATNPDFEGQHEDVCKPCAESEKQSAGRDQ